MADQDNNILDDPLVGDGNSAWDGGLVSATPANLLEANQFADAGNMDFDPMGRPVTRRGARSEVGNPFDAIWSTSTDVWSTSTKAWGSSLGSSIIEAAFYFDTAADESVVLARNVSGTRKLTYGKPTAAWTDIVGATYTQSPVYFAQLADRLYYCDGSSALAYITSGLASASITAGKVSSIKITEPGIGYTSVPAITFSSGAAAATAVLGYGGKVVSATVTSAGSGYSSTTPPTISFAAAPAGGTTATGVVNITQIPAKPRFLVSHTNRLFCSSADTSVPPDTLYASDFLDGESWDLVGNSIRIGGDGDPITGLFSWRDNYLIVGKERSTWLVNCDPTLDMADWTVQLLNGSVGCSSHNSFSTVGRDVYFLGAQGVYSVSVVENGAQTMVGLPVSAPVRDIIQRINWTASSTIHATFYRNRYMIALPLDSNTYPQHVLVFDAKRQAWLGLWTGWAPTDFVATGFSGNQRLCFADYNGKFWTWDDYTSINSETISQFCDDTANIASYLTTRAYNHNEPLVGKLGYSVQYQTDNRITGSSAVQTLAYAHDMETSFTTLATTTLAAGTRFQQVSKPLISGGRYNNIQFKVSQPSGKLVLNTVAVMGYADTISPSS